MSEPEVLLFTIDAGGGHRSAARALCAAAEETGAPFRLRVESFQQALLALDILKRATGVSIEDGYNWILRQRWNAAMVPLLRVIHAAIRVRRPAIVRTLAAWLREQPRPAAVISVMPNFNGVMRDAIREAIPGTPLVVVLTDFADFPPRFWIEPGLDRVVVGTDEAREQALAIGIPEERVSRVSGMVMHPRFYRAGGPSVRGRVREELGFGEADFAVTLLFGGKGSPEMAQLSERLLATDPAFRVVAICGENPRLHARLAPLEARAAGRLVRLGFTDRVAELLAASDLLVTKPGPGSLSEAFHQGVPVVVTRNVHTIPQERFNTDFVRDRGLGLVVSRTRDVPDAALRLFRDAPGRSAIRVRLAALPQNRAVYEVIDIVAAHACHQSGDCMGVV
ncbi:MAG TPA: galactosyldiacylglycerol synthase [Vicinamibacteria bacterium]|nr:galactosyldiacylglycerol synthase [Vicinamibacteria bacterium]